MSGGSLQLHEYPTDVIRLSSEKCGRAGRYKKPGLIARYGADIRLPDLRQEIAEAGVMDKCTTPAACTTSD